MLVDLPTNLNHIPVSTSMFVDLFNDLIHFLVFPFMLLDHPQPPEPLSRLHFHVARSPLRLYKVAFSFALLITSGKDWNKCLSFFVRTYSFLVHYWCKVHRLAKIRSRSR